MASCPCYCSHMQFFFLDAQFHCMSVSVFAYFSSWNICVRCVFVRISVFVHMHVQNQRKKNASVYEFFTLVCVCLCMCVWPCACMYVGASVTGIVSKRHRGSRENVSHVCGLITINSPFDCNWCLNLRSPPPLGRPLVPPSILSS